MGMTYGYVRVSSRDQNKAAERLGVSRTSFLCWAREDAKKEAAQF